MSILEESEQFLKHVGPYTLLEEVGSGSTCTVWKAKHTVTQLIVAIKIIPKTKLSTPNKITRFIREIELLKKAEHPLIVEFYQHIEDEENHYLVMEYISNGSLASHIHETGPLSEQLSKKIFVQLFSVLEYLHKKLHIIHRDLKAENILLDEHLNIRVIDFGLSKEFSEDHEQFNSICGSKCTYFLDFFAFIFISSIKTC